ncbi:ABC transporter permease [Halolactibacillus alkaliphilus]|uniref:ABC transporter permease n=1 Tax=Halolactibacillus alkaliphilus TaxID=442899 RepID=A0A511X0L9_9BACI|nr:ABC transporter permease [Halolactibacillus alkaliphilus]GEN56493.1 ABC transporter permease [Halolactibacillus alkaliphilus]GGN69560.1 ABC transporter permease [Halolactibacillus alkaliphilus]SFO74384.1 ABC-2 type transport system permease protein [Halolactibacillus alkaliphilus]
MDSRQLFKIRFTAHIKHVMRYAQYILNGHIAIALIFLVVAFAVIYQQFLLDLPEAFPVSLVMSVLFSLVILYNPIQTFTKQADLVFLLPTIESLKGFFYRGLVYSFFFQSYLMILILAAISPLYHARFTSGNYLFIIFLFLIFKLWHFIMSWASLRLRDQTLLFYTKVGLFIVQTFVWYSYLKSWTILFIIGVMGLFLILSYLLHQAFDHSLALDQLIMNDQHRLERFYRLASLFTDVRELSTRVKKRQLLSRLLTSSVMIKQKETFTYLYRLTFSRSEDYLGLSSRLVVIGGVALAAIDQTLLSFGIGVLFIYLIGIQLLPLFSHHDTKLWLLLYPVNKQEKERAFLQLLTALLSIVVLVLTATIMLRLTLLDGLLFLVLAGIFSYGFVWVYAKNKVKARK